MALRPGSLREASKCARKKPTQSCRPAGTNLVLVRYQTVIIQSRRKRGTDKKKKSDLSIVIIPQIAVVTRGFLKIFEIFFRGAFGTVWPWDDSSQPLY